MDILNPIQPACMDPADIKRLYGDRQQFIRLLVLYIGMFASFLADPRYYLRGIDRTGLHPVG